MLIEQISGNIGAEISDVDLANITDDEVEKVKKAWLDHKVLVFRKQHITVEEHIAFGMKFGELEIHPFARGGHVGLGDYPEILRIASNPEKEFAAVIWHSDVTWREEPSLGSILRGVVIPETGGDTCFASAAAAYQLLPDSVANQIAAGEVVQRPAPGQWLQHHSNHGRARRHSACARASSRPDPDGHSIAGNFRFGSHQDAEG